MATALQTARTNLFRSSGGDRRKAVVVFALGNYGERSVIDSVKSEAEQLLQEHGADIYYITPQTSRDEVSYMALSPNNIFGDVQTDPRQVFSTITARCGDGFKSLKICNGWSEQLSCSAGRQISILSANFGRVGYTGETSCGAANPLNCEADDVACPYVDAHYEVAQECDGKTYCTLNVNESLLSKQLGFFPPACSRQATYLDVNYICADSEGNDGLPPCTFTPASRFLVVSRGMSIDASSYASCMSCGRDFQTNGGTCSSGARSQCHPAMATFDYSATESWCPAIDSAYNSWIEADLGAPYVVLGVLVQGRRRISTQYVNEISIQVSNDKQAAYQQVVTSESTPTQTFRSNANATDISWISFEGNQTVARYVRLNVVSYGEHPALHFEVVINNRGLIILFLF